MLADASLPAPLDCFCGDRHNGAMGKSIKDRLQEIRREVVLLEAELGAMGEHAPQEIRDRLARVKANAVDSENQQRSLERRLGRLKRAARRARPAYEAMTVEMPKWRTNILLGLNSAAIIAVIGSERISAIGIGPIIAIFLLGAGAALASGSALDVVGSVGLEYHDELEKYDLDDPEMTSEEYDEAVKVSGKLNRITRTASFLRMLSFGFFAGGVLVTANMIR
jgi:hypothetical protein